MFFLIKNINYFIVGCCAGLLAWLISLFQIESGESIWIYWLIIPFGFFVGGAIGVAEQIFDSDRKFMTFIEQFQWFIIGGVLGTIGGAAGAFTGKFVFYMLMESGNKHVLFPRLCGIFVLGMILGLFVGLGERIRMGSWERCFSIVTAGGFGSVIGGLLFHFFTQFSGSVDFLGVSFVLFGGLLVMAINIVTQIKTSAKLLGHPDNLGVKYGEGFEYALPSDSDLWIGSGMRERNSPKTKLKIYADNKVDKIQAAIGYRDDGWTIIQAPEFPRYGEHTYINGKQIAGRTRLRNGDIVTFGKTKFRFVTVDEQKEAKGFKHSKGKILHLFLIAIFTFWGNAVGVCNASTYRIQPDSVINVKTYPKFEVPFHMIDVQSGLEIPVEIKGEIDPGTWHVEDDRGRTLGTVLSVKPLDVQRKEDKLYIVLTFDLSKSMDVPANNPRLEQAIEVATKFIRHLETNCYIALLPFAATVPDSDDLIFYDQKHREILIQRVESLRYYGGFRYCTALYPALHRSIRALRNINEPSALKTVILFTDGYQDLDEVTANYDCREYKKRFPVEELDEKSLHHLVTESQIPIYAIGFNLPDEKAKEGYLRQLTIDSNIRSENRFFKDSGESLLTIYDKLHNVTQARRFLLTFETQLESHVFVNPPPVFISTESIGSESVQKIEKGVSSFKASFFELPSESKSQSVRSRLLATGLVTLLIFLLIVIQAFLKIIMLSKQKQLEMKELPLRSITPRLSQNGLPQTRKTFRDGKVVHFKDSSIKPEKPVTNGQKSDQETKKPLKSGAETEKPISSVFDPYKDVPQPPKPVQRDIPDFEDVPDWMKEPEE
ncbi:VWA domain-containing protein [bacterium]|nr:VWA domain-containing protein [candidate division CSSED10-310 bacterium]